MKKNLVWRLGKLPTVEELLQLVNSKLITNEEAKEILFKSEDVDEVDKKSLEEEIKFLRQLVEKVANNRSTIVEQIRYIEKPYYSSPWYQPYQYWCGSSVTLCSAGTTGNLIDSSATTNLVTTNTTNSFTDIKTF